MPPIAATYDGLYVPLVLLPASPEIDEFADWYQVLEGRDLDDEIDDLGPPSRLMELGIHRYEDLQVYLSHERIFRGPISG